jgi:uncharacterized membrane protein
MGKLFYEFLFEKIMFIFCSFVLFGVYNLTTRALFSSRYPVSIILQDMAWGSLYNMVFTCVYMIVWRRFSDPVDL